MYSVVYGVDLPSLGWNVGGGRDYDTLDAAQRCFDRLSRKQCITRVTIYDADDNVIAKDA